MIDQVTSIEQSKRLIELGVPAEKASMVWFAEYKIGDNKLPIYPTGNYELVMKYKSFGDMEDKAIPAFTVADLLNIIPEGSRMDACVLRAVLIREEKIGEFSTNG